MSWRTTIKTLFADYCNTALGGGLQKFGAWNSQNTNIDTEETLPELSIFFEYSTIGDGIEYLLSQNVRQADRIPVEVTLHIMFNNYNEQNQDLAYDYAEKITCEIVGRKHELVHGRIMKVGESEDANHRAQYDYQIVFAFFVKEAVFKIGIEEELDANPVTEIDPNPATGRRLKTGLEVKFKE